MFTRFLVGVSLFLNFQHGLFAQEGELSSASYEYNKHLPKDVVLLKVASPKGTTISYSYKGHTVTSKNKGLSKNRFVYYFVDLPANHSGPLNISVKAKIPVGGNVVRASTPVLNIPAAHETSIQFKMSVDKTAARASYWKNRVVKTSVRYDRPRSFFFRQGKSSWAYLAIRGEPGMRISLRKSGSKKSYTWPAIGANKLGELGWNKFTEGEKKDRAVVTLTATLDKKGRTHKIKIPDLTLIANHLLEFAIKWHKGKLTPIFFDPRSADDPKRVPLDPIFD